MKGLGKKEIEKFYQNMSKREFEYHVHISEQNSYIYFETPKTGSTTIKLALQELEALTSGKAAPSRESAEIHNKNNSLLLSPRNIGAAKFYEMLEDDNVYKFGFVRNPYTRLLSAFLSKMSGHASNQRKMILNVLGLSGRNDVSFPQFVEAVTKQSIFEMDPHWRPQVSQLFYDLVKYSFVGKFEQLNEDLDKVLNHIVLSNSSESCSKTLFEVGFARKGKNTSATSKCRDFYDDRLREIVYSVYQKDFQSFGYSPELLMTV